MIWLTKITPTGESKFDSALGSVAIAGDEVAKIEPQGDQPDMAVILMRNGDVLRVSESMDVVFERIEIDRVGELQHKSGANQHTSPDEFRKLLDKAHSGNAHSVVQVLMQAYFEAFDAAGGTED